ncbi:MAG: hypothetical protein KJO13_03765, partial [Gammaproteobacteria bacterium]|nr:hypothetical protein [Gammaproteobacteria bacterium]
MDEGARFAYMQARIQARHGDRLTQEQWQQLDACRDAGRYLQLARASNLGHWVRHFAAHEDPAQWERSLRADWNRNLLALTDWVPDRWRATMLWLQSLPLLPAISLLLHGERPMRWMRDDPFFAEFDLSGDDAFRESLHRSAWSPLVAHWYRDHPVESWMSAWRTRWPGRDAATVMQLEQTCDDLAATWRAPDAYVREWHDALEAKFIRLLRRRPRTILAMIGHVGLVS